MQILKKMYILLYIASLELCVRIAWINLTLNNCHHNDQHVAQIQGYVYLGTV